MGEQMNDEKALALARVVARPAFSRWTTAVVHSSHSLHWHPALDMDISPG